MKTYERINKLIGTNYSSNDEINWLIISQHQKLSEEFIREFQDKARWYYISQYQKLSEEFIREFQDKVAWFAISQYQKLSEEFIREFQDKVNWHYLSAYQKLSEEFIREFKDKVTWWNISQYQKLSEDFIKEFKDKVPWHNISKYQKLSEDFIRKFQLDIYDNWNYVTTEFKRKQIINSGLYECHDDHFIAYKAIREDRYSFFNFQYQYLTGKTYEAHCDCTNEENSFGLSVWTKEGAKEYNNTGIIVKCRVNYEDVGRLVHNSNKIRCFKITVLR